MNDNLYYKKYIKYKNKYNFLKNQINVLSDKNNLFMNGGNKLNFFDNTIGFDSGKLKQINYEKRFGNYIKSYESDKFGIIDIIGEENSNVINAENIDRNIIFCNYGDSGLDDNFMTNFSFEYISRILKENYPDTNLYISFAPLDIKDFYLPKFLEEFLDSNINEKLTVVFIGKDYSDRFYTSFSLDIKILNNYLKLIKEKYSERINLIHVYINFRFILYDYNSKNMISREYFFTTNFINFLNNNYRNEKQNILYIGLNACGLIEKVYGIENTDYILIGCDYIKYKNNVLGLPEKNFDYITKYYPNKMSEVIDSNKITYEMIKCIKK